MSLLTALSSATAGLDCSSTDLSVISNNIANANTTGFKSGQADFEDSLTQSVAGTVGTIGIGSQLQAVQTIETQGALTSTGVNTDLALQGNGFFVVNGSLGGGASSNFYTRDGEFTIDQNGNLVNEDGLDVQGYAANAAGTLSTALGNLQVGNATAEPAATTTITCKADLDPSSPIMVFNPASPTTTSDFNTTVGVYDSLGTEHQAQIFFTQTAAGAWGWNAMADGGGLTGGTAGTLTSIASGTLTFGSDGQLTAETQASTFNPINATNPQALTFNFGDPTGTGGTGLAGVTQFATTSGSATTFIGQDGYGSGQLSSLSINSTGTISGTFTNGQTRTLGEVAVAGFSAPDQLQSEGGNLLQQSEASGEPVVGAAGAGGRASIVAGSLEQSNVDLTDQFVKMIAAQEDFQANSKTITTADQLLSDLMNIGGAP